LPELRREVASFASYGHVAEPQTLEARSTNRSTRTAAGHRKRVFGALACCLQRGAVRVVAYGAAQRSHEIGVRLALGAEPRGVLWMVLRGALWLVAMGLAIGLRPRL